MPKGNIYKATGQIIARMAGKQTKKKSKVATATEKAAALRREMFANLIPDEFVHIAATYPKAVRKVRRAWQQGLLPRLDAMGIIDDLKQQCEDECCITFQQAASQSLDPILNLTPLFERTDAQLLVLQQALNDMDDVRLDLGVKKKYLQTINRLLLVRKRCRSDAAAFWLYVGTDDNPQRAGQQIEYAPCHILMFAIWNDDKCRNSLIEAPVGHGKSTCMRGQIAFEIGKMPELRHLYITEAKELAHRTVGSLRRIISSPRFRAIFPDLVVLDRNQKAEDSSRCFTVGRLNSLAKDPTLIGVGWRSSIQGSRFDRIWPDDICPEEVRWHPRIRDKVNEKWHSIVKNRLADWRYSRIRMIGTPWDAEDVLGTTLADIKDGRLRSWRYEIDAFRIRIDKATDKPIPIWPKNWNVEALQEIRNTSRAWSFTHELRFDSQETRILRRVHYYNSVPVPGDPPEDKVLLERIEAGERWLSIDPSGTGEAWSSGQGVVEFVISPKGWVFLTDVWIFRCTVLELIDKLVDILHDPNVAGGTRYTGTQWEVAGGVKVGFAAIRLAFEQSLEERHIPKGQLTFIESGTKFGGTKHSMSKRARWENAAPYFERASVRLAGTRVHRGPGVSSPCPIPGSRVAKLADLLLTWDGDKKTSDTIDATSQFILWNAGRIIMPTIAAPVVHREPPKEYSHLHMERYRASQALLNALIETEPMEDEQKFLESLAMKGVA